MNRHCKALELDKVLALLAEETGCADAADLARELEPASSLFEAKRRMDETDAAYQLMARFGAPSFGQMKNVDNALRRAEAGASLSLRELLDIAETLRVIRSVFDWRRHCEGMETVLDDRFSVLAPNKYLEEKIGTTVVSEEEVADNASPALADIRRKMRSAALRIREQLDRMIRSPAYQKLLQDPIVTIRDGRFVVPVKAEHRAEVPGLVHDTSASGATVFVEPMGSVEANNELKVLESRESAEIERILAALSAEIGNFADAISADYGILVELNLIFAKARLAYKMKAVCPRLTDDGQIRLRHARHPLIDPQKVVPIDVELGVDFDTLVITGPNTGGKTVTLKTIGLLTLMAMCGLMPPVDDGSSLSVFSSVLADIGDEQSIEQSLSTFSAHMTNIIRILGDADEGSLVLLDELGAGTDPVEGAALAIAILERLREQGARIAATTHYAELKAYAIQSPGVENGSCEFDVKTLRPTYRLLVGVPGRSNAFAITERLGMDPAVVAGARDRISGDDRRLEDVVTELEDRRCALERELQTAREATQAAEQARLRAETELEELDRLREQELGQARDEARRLLERARNEAEGLIQELDELRRQKNAADFSSRALEAKNRLRSRLNAAEKAVDPVTKRRREAPVPSRPLHEGDTVLLLDIGKEAVVLTPPDSAGHVEVQAGIIRTRVPLTGLRLLDNRKTAPAAGPKGRSFSSGESRASRSVRTELDLRGQTADEALLELDRFIDDAVMAGLGQITVIHGKGTGALRSAVHAHLRTHPSVKSYRLGTFGEGENGVTIVEI